MRRKLPKRTPGWRAGRRGRLRSQQQYAEHISRSIHLQAGPDTACDAAVDRLYTSQPRGADP